MNFGSDNQYGVDPRIMQAMVDANAKLTEVSYCHDDGAKEAEENLSRIFEKNVKVFLVTNGTSANSLALSTIVSPFGSVLCHDAAHINTDECNAPELFTGGAKLITLKGNGGKITADTVATKLASFVHGEHGAKPMAISITNATELGNIYRPKEIAELSSVARKHNLRMHMDGARFANALVSANCTPAELTWKSGVDILSFGGTKNGGMILEAVVFFDPSLAEDFLYRRKRSGQLMSKGRFLSAQLNAYVQDDVWLANARRANSLAHALANGLKGSNHIRVSQPVEANEVFAFMPKSMHEKLEAKGAHFYEWPDDACEKDETHVRFVLSFATPEKHVEQILKLVKDHGR
jgi:threonine aldolase